MPDPTLTDLFPLPERLKLFYWFDFGDDWKFQIRKAARATEPEPKVKYPRVIEATGKNPVQHPDFD